MAKIAIVGLGKMGVSHVAIANAVETIEVAAVCDSSALLGQMVQKYCGLPYETDYDRLLTMPGVEALVIATPNRLHERMIRSAIAAGKHIFCEKPLTLSADVSQELAAEAEQRGLVTQVGYHNRFVATFREAKRLIDAGAIGRVTHVLGEAYGPVVLKPAAATWRNNSSEGGGSLYDYAVHPINLINWYFGRPNDCVGAILANPLSAEVDDAVYATLRFPSGVTGQLSVNWSDGSVRKMTTRISIWGDKGKIFVDRQELQLFTAPDHAPPAGYDKGWTVKYTTELTPPVSYYLRGEEYSAQIEYFADAIDSRVAAGENDFRSAADTDHTIELIRTAAAGGQAVGIRPAPEQRSKIGRLLGRRA